MIVEAAIQEDVDVIGVSILSGAHLPLTTRLMKLLKERNIGGIPVFLGGTILLPDIPKLKQLGIEGVFFLVTPLSVIIEDR